MTSKLKMFLKYDSKQKTPDLVQDLNSRKIRVAWAADTSDSAKCDVFLPTAVKPSNFCEWKFLYFIMKVGEKAFKKASKAKSKEPLAYVVAFIGLFLCLF